MTTLLDMAKLLIIGGSGRTGLHLLEQAAQRGHTVRALVRKPGAVQAPPGVELVKDQLMTIDGGRAVLIVYRR